MNNANEFLSFIAKNEKRLKHNLKKNITYDANIFDDVFQNTIVKVYDSIVKNDRIVEDFERYFFISSKFEYILQDNRAKKAKNVTDDIESAKDICFEDSNENTDEEMCALLSELTSYLKENYGETNAAIFLDYFQMKSEKKCSYKKIADDYNLPTKIVCKLINGIKSDENVTRLFYNKYKSITEK